MMSILTENRCDELFFCIICLAMSKNSYKMSSSPDKTCESPTHSRLKSIYLSHKGSAPQLPSLSEYSITISPTKPTKLSFETLIQYLQAITDNIFEKDPLKMKELMSDFLQNHLPGIKTKIKQRLSLTQYLSQSLRYKQFAQIDAEIQKEWRRNILMMSISTIWSTRMENYKFNSAEEFIAEYRKFWELVANFTYFYFRPSLSLLESKVNVFNLIQEETAHTVIDNLPEWLHLYDSCLISLLMKKNMREQNQMNMEFLTETLDINQTYIDVHNTGEEHLKNTIEAIKGFAMEHTIASKIERLKEVRQVFLEEIEQSRQKQEGKLNVHQYSPLEKDDIIGCMIYCIVKGQIFKVQVSLQALAYLLGPQSELLSRKGVDSYRADLESAVQFLVEENTEQLITVPEELKKKAGEP